MPFDNGQQRPPRLDRRAPYAIATGHPPPAQQIAAQVRVAGGFTAGRAGVDGARIASLPGGARRADPAMALPLRAGLLLHWLLAHDPRISLPPPSVMIAACALRDWAYLDRALDLLAEQGEITVRRLPHLVVTIARSGAVLKQRGYGAGRTD